MIGVATQAALGGAAAWATAFGAGAPGCQWVCRFPARRRCARPAAAGAARRGCGPAADAAVGLDARRRIVRARRQRCTGRGARGAVPRPPPPPRTNGSPWTWARPSTSGASIAGRGDADQWTTSSPSPRAATASGGARGARLAAARWLDASTLRGASLSVSSSRSGCTNGALSDAGGWCAGRADARQWAALDLAHEVVGVAVRGGERAISAPRRGSSKRTPNFGWVTRFRVRVSAASASATTDAGGTAVDGGAELQAPTADAAARRTVPGGRRRGAHCPGRATAWVGWPSMRFAAVGRPESSTSCRRARRRYGAPSHAHGGGGRPAAEGGEGEARSSPGRGAPRRRARRGLRGSVLHSHRVVPPPTGRAARVRGGTRPAPPWAVLDLGGPAPGAGRAGDATRAEPARSRFVWGVLTRGHGRRRRGPQRGAERGARPGGLRGALVETLGCPRASASSSRAWPGTSRGRAAPARALAVPRRVHFPRQRRRVHARPRTLRAEEGPLRPLRRSDLGARGPAMRIRSSARRRRATAAGWPDRFLGNADRRRGPTRSLRGPLRRFVASSPARGAARRAAVRGAGRAVARPPRGGRRGRVSILRPGLRRAASPVGGRLPRVALDPNTEVLGSASHAFDELRAGAARAALVRLLRGRRRRRLHGPGVRGCCAMASAGCDPRGSKIHKIPWVRARASERGRRSVGGPSARGFVDGGRVFRGNVGRDEADARRWPAG